ncbi:MarR family transcriptional regulator [Pseudonocardia sediminis]|uniref:MarR family transcriptional regulator n=1 Tax=Pseudonocardia sediminis TaxID=1397368 RepID=A0A4Q7URI4_PSEST|nr:MarR family transcriptional regulator [Pseudonocardia sediminis]RZT83368.1 MarR family transcriptional regulator [Pseudonocardia sediminis]
MSTTEGPPPELRRNLTYLLKHAQLRMVEIGDAAVDPYGINGRELGGLLALASHEAASQQQIAQRLGIDRTTTVALLDGLERKGLVSRRPHPDDRRRNVVELTAAGRDTLGRASDAHDEAERTFLASISAAAAQHLRESLHTLVTSDPPAPPR